MLGLVGFVQLSLLTYIRGTPTISALPNRITPFAANKKENLVDTIAQLLCNFGQVYFINYTEYAIHSYVSRYNGKTIIDTNIKGFCET